jgi:NAD(P)-dependent dehydrogenase (short-subunit alcohol dehydrogenase family)
MSDKLSDKAAIVTGASRGIGRAIALALARKGANIIVNYNHSENDAEKVVNEIKGFLTEALAVRADVSKGTEVKSLVKKTLEEFGRIDILVNNAGVEPMNKMVDITEKEWDYVMNINAKGTFLCNQAVALQMIESGCGGKIVNIASQAGKTGAEFLAHYSASKAAIIAFTKAAAKELAPYKINVNCVCPGVIQTDMQRQDLARSARFMGVTEEEMNKRILSIIPLGRFGKPEDIARVVLFLCSEDADYMTGQAINVTGGIINY